MISMVPERTQAAPSHAACFQPEPSTEATATICPAELKAQRMREYEQLSGPVRYHGGPVDWETGQPITPSGVAG